MCLPKTRITNNLGRTHRFAPTGIYAKKEEPRCLTKALLEKVAMTYSPTNICSTIGAVGLNFSVRDGKRWIPNAIDRLNKGPTIMSYNSIVSVFLLLSVNSLSLSKEHEQAVDVSHSATDDAKRRKEKLSGN